ncbi:MAG: glutamyl-tRNA reductase [Bacteroidia bacterium]
MNQIKILALTHKNLELNEVGLFHLSDDILSKTLVNIKHLLNLNELMYLSTCNRVEFIFTTKATIDDDFLLNFFMAFNPSWRETELMFAAQKAEFFEGEKAIEHLFQVASSVDSLVLGEREIITQVRNAFETSNKIGLTGDAIRLLIQQTIRVAKNVYTETSIAKNPVSVVSLAYKELRQHSINEHSNFLVIGSGKTNKTMARFLKKHGSKNFYIYNRTIANAEEFAKEVGGKAFPLTELKNHREHFDVVLTCTSSTLPILTDELYAEILNGDKSRKIIVDLAIPNDVAPELVERHNIELLSINELKEVADKNLKQREKELHKCNAIIDQQLKEFKHLFKTRQVEVAMRQVPEKVKEIKKNALEVVFQKEFENLDSNSKEVLDKILDYVEKKYVSVPMKMAKEILLEADSSK